VRRGPPAAAAGSPALVEKAANLGHLALNALMILVPVTGLSAWFGGIAAVADGHQILKSVLLLIVGPHVAAAHWHQFWRKDRLIERMLRPLD
jgi:cytochrome b561